MNAVILSSAQDIPWGLISIVVLLLVVAVVLSGQGGAKAQPPQVAQPPQQEEGTVRSITEIVAKDTEDQCFLIQVDNGREPIPFRWSFPSGRPKPNGFPAVGDRVMITYEFAFHETRECWIPKGFHLISEGEQEHAGE